jgi:predicted ribonuclease YlaK
MFFYDTCSLLNDYKRIFNSNDTFIISNITLRELENIKTSKTKDKETKYKANKVSKLLTETNYELVNYQRDWDDMYIEPNPVLNLDNDTRIVVSALHCSETKDITFVTDDVNCYNIARSIGLNTKVLSLKCDREYKGYKEYICYNNEDISKVYDRIYSGDTFDLLENEYLVLKEEDKILDSYVFRDNKLTSVDFNVFSSKMLGNIKPLDTYQKLAADSLKHNTITMLRGAAGTGKSYLGLGYLFYALENGKIDKIIIFCNTVATYGSAKLGYYPGSRTEKLLDSQIGNFLISKLGDRSQIERMISEGQLMLLPMSDIRGFDTTGMNAGVYITEAQNLDVQLMKLALQRIGDDSICILDGDSDTQVDLEIYSGLNNGMRRVSEVFKGQPFYGEVTLPVCYRSQIAKIAEKM